jgi:hypothetical protein
MKGITTMMANKNTERAVTAGSSVRKLFLCLTLLLSAALCSAESYAQPAISTQDTLLDYGTLEVGTGFRKIIRVKNNTSQQLNAQVNLPADAVSIGFSLEGSSTKPLAPNQTINVNVRFDARSVVGSVQKSLTIAASGVTLTVTLKANAIAAIVKHRLTLRTIGSVGGGELRAVSGGRTEIVCQVAGTGNNDSCASLGNGSFQSGSAVTITATGTFQGWRNGTGSASACNGNSNPCTFTITTDSQISAQYPELKKFRINLEKIGNGAGTIEAIFGANNVLASVGPENGSRSGETLQDRLIKVNIKPAFGSKVTALIAKGTSAGSNCETSFTGCTFTLRSDASFRVTFSRTK